MTREDNSLYQRSGKLLYRKYRAFFLPTILASISTSMSIIVDSVIVGNMLGAAPMASVNLCLPVMQVFITLAVLIGMGASTLIAIALGRRDSPRADTVFSTAVFALLFCGLLLTATASGSGFIARWLTDDNTLQILVSEYLQTLFLGSCPIIFVPAFVYILRTDGMARLASAVLIAANITNLLLDIVFIGPCGLGIAGSSLATVCGYAVGMSMLLLYAGSKSRTLHLHLKKISFRQLCEHAGNIVRTGCPAAVSSGLTALKIFCMNLLIGYVAGSTGLIVFSVCISCLSFVSMFISGTAGTMMPLVGTLYGERDFQGVRLVLGYTFRFGMLTTACIVVLFELMPEYVFALFGVTDPAMLVMGIASLRLFAVSLFGVTATFLMLYYFMTIQRPGIATTLSVTEGCAILIPLAWLLSSLMGITGVWVAYILTEIGALGILYIQTLRAKKRSGGRLHDILLIERSAPEQLYDVSLKATPEDAARLSAEAINVLTANGLDPDSAMKVGIALEEIVDNTARYAPNRKRNVNIDVRISSAGGNLLIAVRDDGAFFNPVEYEPEEKECSIDGILLLRTLADSLSYNRVLALNQTMISICKATTTPAAI